MQIIKEKIEFEKSLKQRLDFICEFSNVTPTFINGSIRKIDKTNLSYIEPHRDELIKGVRVVFTGKKEIIPCVNINPFYQMRNWIRRS